MKKTQSILPNSCDEILKPMVGKTGTFLVFWDEQIDMHVLTFTPADKYVYTLAGHHNGYSCHSLAQRMVSGNVEKSLEQLNYILSCGGIAASENLIRAFVQM